MRGYGFHGCVRKLAEGTSHHIHPSAHAEKRKSELLLPKRHTNNNNLFGYLEKVRGIDHAVVSFFVSHGLAYESQYVNTAGKTFSNAVFLGLDKNLVPRQASIRGMLSEYKSEVSGSDKRYSLSLSPADGGSDTLQIFESAIDLMSYVTFRVRNGGRIQSDHLLSLSGIYAPKLDSAEIRIPLAIKRYKAEHHGISKAILRLDNDNAGRLASKALVEALPSIGISAVDAPPEYGKDYNDYLRCKDSREIRQRSHPHEIR
jgi:hypothetical protein